MVELTLKAKADLALAFTTVLLGSFFGLLIANEVAFHWFEIPSVHYFWIFGGAIAVVFLVGMLSYIGPVRSRVEKAFDIVFHQVPWSFLAMMFSLFVFLQFQVRGEALAMAGEPVLGVPVIGILAVLTVTALLVTLLICKLSFGVAPGLVGVVIALAGVVISSGPIVVLGLGVALILFMAEGS